MAEEILKEKVNLALITHIKVFFFKKDFKEVTKWNFQNFLGI